MAKRKETLNKMESLASYLRNNSLDKLAHMDRPAYTVKRGYKPMEKGNTKLSSCIASFSLIPVVTCGHMCKNCYDIKAIRQYRESRIKRQYNTWMAINALDELEQAIIKQIKRSRTIKYIRIHVGGDFFSKEYLDMWIRVRKWTMINKPSILFYTYTKTQYGQELRDNGINCIESILPHNNQGLIFNFGSVDKLKAFMNDHEDYALCPVTKKNKNVHCGIDCIHCMHNAKVLFIEH